jgi:hypothetical protein
MAFCDWHDYNFTAPAFDFSRTHDRLGFVVATLDDHIRPKCIHEIERCVFVKKDDEVNALETRNEVRTIAFAAHGAARPLEAFHRCIGIDPDDQCITPRASGCEEIQVTWM